MAVAQVMQTDTRHSRHFYEGSEAMRNIIRLERATCAHREHKVLVLPCRTSSKTSNVLCLTVCFQCNDTLR